MNVFMFVVGSASLIHLSSGFTTPVSDGNFNTTLGGTISIRNATMKSDGTCVCQIQVPQTIQCTSVSSPETNVNNDQWQTAVESQGSQITTLTNTMMTTLDKLKRIESGNLVVSRPEHERLRQEISDMEALLLMLKQNQTTSRAVVTALEAEIANITAVMTSLEQNEEEDTSRFVSDIGGLKQRLLNCKENQNTGGDLSITWYQPADQDTCGKIESVSSPYTVRGNGADRGTWFRDPVKNQSQIYVFSISNSRYHNYLNIYPTVTEFQNAGTSRRVNLPVYAQGTGMVAYNGSLFFHVNNDNNYNYRGNSNSNLMMGKYDIELQQITKVPLPSDTRNGNNGAYLSNTYSDIDFAVDESGLWVIYSRTSSKGVMIISKVDPETLAFTTSWVTSVPKTTVGNCFVMCRVLYCTNSFNTHADKSKINYYFDTKTSTEGFLYIPIDNKFLASYALNYNPYDQKLYGWDNGHQVVYELSFKGNKE